MRALAVFAALALVAAPVMSAPGLAYADGIERPHPPPRAPQPRPRVVEAPPPAPVAVVASGPEALTLPASFFVGGGGVGTEIGTGYVGSGTTVVIRGGGASAFAFASASARASAGGHFGGHGGGHGCGCGH